MRWSSISWRGAANHDKRESSSTKSRAALRSLQELRDGQINTTAIPDWSGAQRGVSYRPAQQQITLRLDADVISWFKAHAQGGRGDLTDIYHARREHVVRCEREVTK